MKLKIIGVYKITNMVNGKVYIGSSVDVKKRISTHKSKLKANKHHCTHLQYAYNKYGHSAFKASLLERCKREEVFIRERYWMDYCGSNNPEYGYNLRIIADTNKFTWSENAKKEFSKRGIKQADNNVKYMIINVNNLRQKIIVTRKELKAKGYTRKDISNALNNRKLKDNPFFTVENFTGCKLIERLTMNLYNPTANGITIYCYDKDNTLIHTFSSRIECQKHFNCSEKNITKALDQNYRIQKKYYISTSPNYMIPTPTKRKRYGGRKKRSIIIDGIAFSSVEHASHELNIPIATLYSRLHSSNSVAAYLS